MSKPAIGLEQRTSILPTPDVQPIGPGLLGPNYSFADNVPLPGQVGVRDGDSMNDVIDSVKAVAYYVDMIGFGQASSGMSRGVGPGGGPRPLGVNTWMRTGLKCSNGADMWMYNEGVPNGSALGERVKDGLASAGLPAMRGLAPGILEDAQAALNPVPIVKALFGSGFPRCSLVEKEVGDQDGRIKNPAPKGAYYVEDEDSVYKRDGRSYQRRWAYDSDLSQSQWENEKKTHCPDGYRLENHVNYDCNMALHSRKEGFAGQASQAKQASALLSVGVLAVVTLGALAYFRFAKSKR
jgi:hypothetical protein